MFTAPTTKEQRTMTQAYSDPSRADDPYALPDVEVFYADEGELGTVNDDTEQSAAGWYWWPCFPGCLPDGDPCGPFETEAEALEDAQAN
jgi:hypothetical protein